MYLRQRVSFYETNRFSLGDRGRRVSSVYLNVNTNYNYRYEGRHCEMNKNDCLPLNPCLNGGTCHDRVGSYHCECPPGKTGLVCHLDDACASNPCRAPNAICETSVINGSYKCRCPTGYTGHNCDEDINECEEGEDVKNSFPIFLNIYSSISITIPHFFIK